MPVGAGRRYTVEDYFSVEGSSAIRVDDAATLPSMGLALPLVEIYAGVLPFPPP